MSDNHHLRPNGDSDTHTLFSQILLLSLAARNTGMRVGLLATFSIR